MSIKYFLSKAVRYLKGLDDKSKEVECLVSWDGKHNLIEDQHLDFDPGTMHSIPRFFVNIVCSHCEEIISEREVNQAAMMERDLTNMLFKDNV